MGLEASFWALFGTILGTGVALLGVQVRLYMSLDRRLQTVEVGLSELRVGVAELRGYVHGRESNRPNSI